MAINTCKACMQLGRSQQNMQSRHAAIPTEHAKQACSPAWPTEVLLCTNRPLFVQRACGARAALVVRCTGRSCGAGQPATGCQLADWPMVGGPIYLSTTALRPRRASPSRPADPSWLGLLMLLVEKGHDADGRGGLLANTAVCSLGAGLQGPVLLGCGLAGSRALVDCRDAQPWGFAAGQGLSSAAASRAAAGMVLGWRSCEGSRRCVKQR
jgi:hypothetical protein